MALGWGVCSAFGHRPSRATPRRNGTGPFCKYVEICGLKCWVLLLLQRRLSNPGGSGRALLTP